MWLYIFVPFFLWFPLTCNSDPEEVFSSALKIKSEITPQLVDSSTELRKRMTAKRSAHAAASGLRRDMLSNCKNESSTRCHRTRYHRKMKHFGTNDGRFHFPRSPDLMRSLSKIMPKKRCYNCLNENCSSKRKHKTFFNQFSKREVMNSFQKHAPHMPKHVPGRKILNRRTVVAIQNNHREQEQQTPMTDFESGVTHALSGEYASSIFEDFEKEVSATTVKIHHIAEEGKNRGILDSVIVLFSNKKPQGQIPSHEESAEMALGTDNEGLQTKTAKTLVQNGINRPIEHRNSARIRSQSALSWPSHSNRLTRGFKRDRHSSCERAEKFRNAVIADLLDSSEDDYDNTLEEKKIQKNLSNTNTMALKSTESSVSEFHTPFNANDYTSENKEFSSSRIQSSTENIVKITSEMAMNKILDFDKATQTRHIDQEISLNQFQSTTQKNQDKIYKKLNAETISDDHKKATGHDVPNDDKDSTVGKINKIDDTGERLSNSLITIAVIPLNELKLEKNIDDGGGEHNSFESQFPREIIFHQVNDESIENYQSKPHSFESSTAILPTSVEEPIGESSKKKNEQFIGNDDDDAETMTDESENTETAMPPTANDKKYQNILRESKVKSEINNKDKTKQDLVSKWYSSISQTSVPGNLNNYNDLEKHMTNTEITKQFPAEKKMNSSLLFYSTPESGLKENYSDNYHNKRENTNQVSTTNGRISEWLLSDDPIRGLPKNSLRAFKKFLRTFINDVGSGVQKRAQSNMNNVADSSCLVKHNNTDHTIDSLCKNETDGAKQKNSLREFNETDHSAKNKSKIPQDPKHNINMSRQHPESLRSPKLLVFLDGVQSNRLKKRVQKLIKKSSENIKTEKDILERLFDKKGKSVKETVRKKQHIKRQKTMIGNRKKRRNDWKKKRHNHSHNRRHLKTRKMV